MADCLLGLLPQDPFIFWILVAVNVAEVAEISFELENSSYSLRYVGERCGESLFGENPTRVCRTLER
jgi:hypothetical protein